MKKLNILFVMAVVAVFIFTSCTGDKTKLPVLKNQTDSLNYAMGIIWGENLKGQFVKGDSAKKSISQIFAGLKEGQKGKIDKKYMELTRAGEQIGSFLGQNKKGGLLGDSTLKVNYEILKQGLINGLRGSKVQMTSEQAQKYLNETFVARRTRIMEQKFGGNKAAGEKFLAENAKKPGIITTASGLQYEIVKKGSGPNPTDTSSVEVNYVGRLIDGTVFDSTAVSGKKPTTFRVNQVIKGWAEGIKLMNAGSKYKLYIPEQLAYGTQSPGNVIKPFSALIFEVELVSIK